MVIQGFDTLDPQLIELSGAVVVEVSTSSTGS
jgi:hypothetical protein